MKHKGLILIWEMIGVHFVYYLICWIYIKKEMETFNGIGNMLFVWSALRQWECIILIIGYGLLLLKWRLGQAILLLFYVMKACSCAVGISFELDSSIDFSAVGRFLVEMLLVIVPFIVLLYSRNINNYIKLRKKHST